MRKGCLIGFVWEMEVPGDRLLLKSYSCSISLSVSFNSEREIATEEDRLIGEDRIDKDSASADNDFASNNKQLLDEVFVISRIIKGELRVISRSQRLRH